MKHTQSFTQLCHAALQKIDEIDLAWVHAHLNSDTRLMLIDVREDTEWQQGHLPHAIHISRGILERDIEKHVPEKHALMVLYCGGGFRSALAAESIQKMGYTQVKSMQGGYREWLAQGLDIISS